MLPPAFISSVITSSSVNASCREPARARVLLACRLSLLAMIVWRQWRPPVDWLARLRTVVAGAALQSIKFDVEAKEIVPRPHRR